MIALAAGTPEPVLAGRYLVEGPGHCGECHTPRDFAGGLEKEPVAGRRAGRRRHRHRAQHHVGEGGIGSWSEADIANYLETGFTPEFDSVGGAMAEVQQNMAQLTAGGPRRDRCLSQGGAAACQRLSAAGETGGGHLGRRVNRPVL